MPFDWLTAWGLVPSSKHVLEWFRGDCGCRSPFRMRIKLANLSALLLLMMMVGFWCMKLESTSHERQNEDASDWSSSGRSHSVFKSSTPVSLSSHAMFLFNNTRSKYSFEKVNGHAGGFTTPSISFASSIAC
ncbi:hypothetical protein TorRG33x02_013970 [Trema orientale]|uniref:Transmembrane protein n=1 Tax=Trema orientale TaxID=63057 RepID=A0A2P5FX88_TREOI|nr:hypothetical protein TorRG33x02_013970 [Trema orientale]